MSVKEIKALYDSLVDSGDFEFLFPNFTGDWLVDKKEFSTQYNSNQKLLNDTADTDIEFDDIEF